MSTDVKQGTAAEPKQVAVEVVLKQLLFVLAICLACILIFTWISDAFVLTYRTEWDAGNLASSSLGDLVNRLVAIGKIPKPLGGLLVGIAGDYYPKGVVRFLSASAELCAVLVCSFAPRRLLLHGCLSLSALCPLVFVLLTMSWDMSHIPNFCDQFGWHCISLVTQCLAVLVGCVIALTRAKMTKSKVTSKSDVLLLVLFLVLLLGAVTYYDRACGLVMHMG